MHYPKNFLNILLLGAVLTGGASAAPSQGIEGLVHHPGACLGVQSFRGMVPGPCVQGSQISVGPRVFVHIFDRRGQEVATPLTDVTGYFSTTLPAGVYTVRLPDYETDTGVQVTEGHLTRTDLLPMPRPVP